nr:MAG TPA: hypothetical protein [Caudoviricetes sp.]
MVWEQWFCVGSIPTVPIIYGGKICLKVIK